MSNIQAKTVNGQLIQLDTSSIDALKSIIHGRVITPQDSHYEKARSVWNAMIDRYPALIIQCAGTADVIKAVRFAKEHDLLISVRGAGHNIAGRSLEDHVLLIDLCQLRYVHVDPDEATATVGPGATLADLDQEAQEFGLAVPVGINSTTGIAGLTLGGGFGWLSRKLGMTIDNLISAEVVTVDGKRLVCSQDKYPELFWAIRGGGGNFCIVTSFKFKLHQVGPSVFSGPVVFDIHDAKKLLQRYRDWCRQAPDEAIVWAILRACPPFPFVDPSYHGKLVLIFVGLYAGDVSKGEKILSELKTWGKPLGEHLGVHPFAAFQKSFDPLLTPGGRNYWKTHNFKHVDDALIDTILTCTKAIPTVHTELFLAQMGGVTNQIPKAATAYPHRDIQFIMNVHTRWEDKKDDACCISWARDVFKATIPFSAGGAYVNFISEGDENLDEAYSGNREKLAAIKAQYDPQNILRTNLNISPTKN